MVLPRELSCPDTASATRKAPRYLPAKMVAPSGLEPDRPLGLRILKPLGLPIPPRGLVALAGQFVGNCRGQGSRFVEAPHPPTRLVSKAPIDRRQDGAILSFL